MKSAIYIAAQSQGVIAPAFKERELNLMPSKVTDVTISVYDKGMRLSLDVFKHCELVKLKRL